MASGARGAANPSARAARRIAVVVFYGLLGVFVISVTYQITRQVFFAQGDPSPYPTCEEGLDALTLAIARARDAAPGLDGEDAAVTRFREALLPEWGYRADIGVRCGEGRDPRAALDAIDRLRYAEEHAARREAHELAPLRRRVEGAPLAAPKPSAP